MDLKKGYSYHIYNRGNQGQKIFYNRENYLFFLQKMNTFVSPYASFLAWCLMPNHFHWLVYVKKNIEITMEGSGHPTQSGVTTIRERSLNQTIGILLASYTRAIQKQKIFSGSLFQKRTKAKALVDSIRIEPSYWNTSFGTQINIAEGRNYLETCLEYIHLNPVYSGLVKHPADWEFSSFRDFSDIRKGKLIDYDLLKKEGIFKSVPSGHPTLSRVTTAKEINECIIGIGSNINADLNIKKMLEIIRTELKIIKVSNFIKTKPIGIANQPDYTNGALKAETKLSKHGLNKYLKEVEDQLGRDRTEKKFGPRTMDLDIVAWNGEIVDKDYYERDFLRTSVDQII